MSTPDTQTLLIKSALTAAGLTTARVATRLVDDDARFETTVEGVLPSAARLVLLGYLRGAYGTSVEVKGRAVIVRQLNK